MQKGVRVEQVNTAVPIFVINATNGTLIVSKRHWTSESQKTWCFYCYTELIIHTDAYQKKKNEKNKKTKPNKKKIHKAKQNQAKKQQKQHKQANKPVQIWGFSILIK